MLCDLPHRVSTIWLLFYAGQTPASFDEVMNIAVTGDYSLLAYLSYMQHSKLLHPASTLVLTRCSVCLCYKHPPLPLTLIGYGLKFCLGIAMTPFLYMMKVSKPDMHTAVLLHSAASMLILVSAVFMFILLSAICYVHVYASIC